MKALFVMPVYNQAEELPPLLEKCRRNMPADEFVIVDNGSDDGSAKMIAESGFDFIRLDKNYGIGYALRIGVEKALERGCDIVGNIAGNGKMAPEQMHRVIDPIKNGEADYVTGSRFLPGGDSPNLPAFRKFSIPLVVNTLVMLLFRRKLTDATCGYRAFKIDLVHNPQVRWQDKWLRHYQFEYYLYAKAIKLKYRCIEVPISMIYPAKKKNYSKIKPFVGWWEMLQPWLLVGLGIR
ncbi:MAG: glycosyltransferase family 2 protein [Victivallaceae bacterium]|nr:glycosyltransferase family 2 protein [Victivallaceae bacterium]